MVKANFSANQHYATNAVDFEFNMDYPSNMYFHAAHILL